MSKVKCPVCQRPCRRGLALHVNGNDCWGPGVEWNEEAHTAWKRKKYAARTARGGAVKMLLTGAEYCQLLEDAGITAADIGQKLHLYQLGRYGDKGDYEVGNCRFITMRENLSEVVSPPSPAHLNPQSKPVLFNGKRYDGIGVASRATGIPRYTIPRRCISKNYPEWRYESDVC